jgi:hypothetical protein
MQPPDDLPEELEGDFPRGRDPRHTHRLPSACRDTATTCSPCAARPSRSWTSTSTTSARRGDTPTDVAIVLVELRHAIARAEAEPCQPN